MNNFKFSNLIIFSFFAIFMSLPSFSEAANLISIIIADTKDDEIGKECASDFNKMVLLVERISKHTEMNLIEIKIKGSDVKPRKILDKIDSIKIEPDDVVLFYYTGHGYRTKSMGTIPPWPIFEFPETDEGLESEYVMAKLEMKRPRLLLAICDCCNVFLKKHEMVPDLVRAVKPRKDMEISNGENYRRLFRETIGVIKIASAKPGEYSYTTEDEDEDGGKFTVAFLKSLKKEVNSSEPASWNSLISRSADLVEDKKQHPVWTMHIVEQVPLEDNKN